MIYEPTGTIEQSQDSEPCANQVPENADMPLDLLPAPFAAMAKAIVETARVPPSLAGCCVLGAISASTGSGLRVNSGPERHTHANLYILASAVSGSGKSEAFRLALAPFFEAEMEEINQWRESTFPAATAEKDLLECEINKLKKEVQSAKEPVDRDETVREMRNKQSDILKVETALREPIYSVEDATSEVLALRLRNPSECLASLSPDAGAIINNLFGRYNKSNRTDESIYLKAWSGDSCKVDRINRQTVVLKNPCLAALWLVQPDKIDSLISEKSFSEGGLLPRLLICHTNTLPRRITGQHNPIPSGVRTDYSAAINELLAYYHSVVEPVTIRPSEEANEILINYYNETVDKITDGTLKDVASFAARWAEQAWRVAVCLHAGQWLNQSHKIEMAGETAWKAMLLTDWFTRQQLELLSDLRMQPKLNRLSKLVSHLKDNNGCATVRDLSCRNGFSRDELVELAAFSPRRVKIEDTRAEKSGGRPSKIVRLNEN